jgi:hypothetical protein
MVAELLSVDALRSKSVDLPGLAELTARSSVARPPPFVMHDELLRILTLLPGREVTRTVKKRDDKHASLSHRVLKPVLVYEHFANGRVVSLPRFRGRFSYAT